MPLLIALARRAGLPERTEAMFAGVHINTSEDRAVLHTALRAAARRSRSPSTARTCVTDVHAVLDRMGEFADAVRVRGVDRATPASGSAPSSTSASAARTSAR